MLYQRQLDRSFSVRTSLRTNLAYRRMERKGWMMKVRR
ncbi:hypothetical protein SAMN05216580_1803 [Geopseudomonas guangdongensis]|uniref:Uncharacterized protein n=1 Tax=Geopseudomonas guangdongensis TaxID=1245526 RepID=A0A1H2GIV9_9GAMM|nr:hypothetical protein SAMN05216580_1803 [Pseudomonas guangdongensis]